ncbi:(2Fe-2S) ferredoxin domain-containing protein [Desulfobotulus mexicanus]|jgi:(2Fe-2S) ferredoxin|uniref:(2Fe-2S) ferredoxin domain-containing protein n=1 Tax=Desulfobotulus mexicanus TaxID=2586642 RepID=A0A5Q4VEN1_9BACT|nr:(2Fe-2S) ferredoxin domain-containing protein [Desulfobotulus mexicanus]TYT74620.1 (2Fe-2S) ferredoxin domain-containing protein [Desulfobotulus mexicanus]
MALPQHTILVCASFRVSGDPQGVCHKKGAASLLPYIEEEILDRGLDAQVVSTGCLKQCEKGPVLVVYPQNVWYGGVESESSVDAILDAMEEGAICQELALGQAP